MSFYRETIQNGHPDLAPGPALEAQYLMRAAVPNWASYMAQWDDDAQAVRAKYETKRDIAYGATLAERLDIVLPAKRHEKMPVLFLVHGGYWRALDKDSILFAARAMAENGVVTVNIDYALCPHVTLTELTVQCHAALRWVHANIANYGGDPENIHCAGHSAGAHLSTILALAPEFTNCIRSVTAVSGLFDLAPIALASMQADLQLTEQEIRLLSPLRLPPPRSGNWIFAVGTAETPAFIWNTERYAAYCIAGGANCKVILLGGANHYSAISVLGQNNSALQRAWLRQVKLLSPTTAKQP